jgi:hypothetical protein
LLISNNLPFLIITGYYVGGMPQQIEDHINYYGNYGKIRENLYDLNIVKSEEDLFSEVNLVWCKNYSRIKMPDNLEVSIKEQISKAIKNGN